MTKRQNAGGVDYNGGASNKTPESEEEKSGNQTEGSVGGSPDTCPQLITEPPCLGGHGRHSNKPTICAPSRFHGILIN